MTNISLDLSGKIDKDIAMDVLQGDRFAEKSYEKVSAFFDALLKGLTDHKNR